MDNKYIIITTTFENKEEANKITYKYMTIKNKLWIFAYVMIEIQNIICYNEYVSKTYIK